MAENYSFDQKIELLYKAVPGKNNEFFKKDLQVFIRNLHAYDTQSPAKRIKKIFKETTARYLLNYSTYAFFPEIADNGQFNCVTGTALFAIIFDELEIPYHVVEVPGHVYLVAYPGSHKIGVESTSERDGIYNWTEQTKRDAVGFLIAIEKVTAEEARLKGADKIIEEFFYSNAELTFKELAGIHFMNRALYLSDREEYTEALECIDEARALYNGESLAMIEGAILIYQIEKTDTEDIAIVNYMTRYYAIVKDKPERKRTLANFDIVIGEAQIDRRDLAFVDSAETLIRLNLPEQADRNLFIAVIEENKAIWHYNRGKMKEAMIAAELSYALNPANKNVEDMIGAILAANLSDQSEDPEALIIEMEGYVEKYPFLKESPMYLNFELMVYAWLVTDYYLENEEESGKKYLVLMEALLEHPDVEQEDAAVFIGEAYGEISTFYFRKKNFEEALKWIDIALKYDSESVSNQVRKEYILLKL